MAVPGNSLDLAEFGSVQMEMTRLSQVTGVSKYMDVANDIVTRVQNTKTHPPGLYAIQWTDKPFKPSPSGKVMLNYVHLQSVA
jgi:Glycosyl hydrolase family 47